MAFFRGARHFAKTHLSHSIKVYFLYSSHNGRAKIIVCTRYIGKSSHFHRVQCFVMIEYTHTLHSMSYGEISHHIVRTQTHVIYGSLFIHSRDTRFPVLYPASWLNALTKQHTHLGNVRTYVLSNTIWRHSSIV